jgi:hypothetical protein
MDQLRAQLGNYLEWMENRGLTGPVAFRAPADAPAQQAPLDNQASAGVRAELQQHGAEEAAVRSASTPEAAGAAPHRVADESQADARSAAALRSAAAPATPTVISENTQSKASTTPQREAGMPWKVGFYSSSDLTEEEFIMVSKIALALGLPAEDFKIWAEDSLVHVPLDLLRCAFIVALGPGSGQTLLALGQTVAMNSIQTALQGSPILTIPHPRAMLREPALKGGAWTALQKLKALIMP